MCLRTPTLSSACNAPRQNDAERIPPTRQREARETRAHRWPHDRFALGTRVRLRTHVGLKLERDLRSAEPPPTLIDRLNFFFENFVKTVGSGDRHGSPTDQLLTVTRLPSYPAEILDCKRSIVRSREPPDARFLAIK